MKNSFTVTITWENETTWTQATLAKTKEEALNYVIGNLRWRQKEAIAEGEAKAEVK
jgi:hypothetical protein